MAKQTTTPQDYRKNVYLDMKDLYGDDFTKTEQEFNALLDSDPNYANNVYLDLKDGFGDEFKRTPEEFASLVGLKKKEPTGSGTVLAPSKDGGIKLDNPFQSKSPSPVPSVSAIPQNNIAPVAKQNNVGIPTTLKGDFMNAPETEVATQGDVLPVDNELKVESLQSQRDKEREAYLKSIDTGQSKFKSALNSAAKAIVNTPADILTTIGVGAKTADWFGEYDGKKLEDLETIKMANGIREWSKEMFPENPAYQEELSTAIGQGAGQLVTMLGGGAVGKLPGTFAITSSQSGANTFNDAYERYEDVNRLTEDQYVEKYAGIAQTADVDAPEKVREFYKQEKQSKQKPIDKAFDNMLFSMATASAEMLPAARYMKLLNKSTGGAIAKGLSNKIVDIAKTGVLEGATEVLQSSAENWDAKRTYDVTREITDGLKNAGISGLILGSSVHGLSQIIQRKKEQTTDPVENAQLDAAQQELDNIDNDIAPVESPTLTALEQQEKEITLDLTNDNLPPDVKDNLFDKLSDVTTKIKEETEKLQKELAEADLNNKVQEALTNQKEVLELALTDPELSETAKGLLQEKLKEIDSKISVPEIAKETVDKKKEAKTAITKPDEVVIGDIVEDINGKRGTVTGVEGGQIAIDLDNGATMTANPSNVELFKVTQNHTVNTEPTGTENVSTNETGIPANEEKSTDAKENKITPILPKEDYELSPKTEVDALYDIQEGLGFRIGQNGYTRKGDTVIRVKNHTPDWSNFKENIENGANVIVNVTVGDFNNSDSRRNKTGLAEMQAEFPDVTFVNLEVNEGESVSEAISKIANEINNIQPLKPTKNIEREAEELITRGVENSRYQRDQLISEGKTREQADDIVRDEWLNSPDGKRYTELMNQTKDVDQKPDETILPLDNISIQAQQVEPENEETKNGSGIFSEDQNKRANKFGYDSPFVAVNSVNKNLGKEYTFEDFDTIPDKEFRKASKKSETVNKEKESAKEQEQESPKETTLRNADVEQKRKEYGFDAPVPRKGQTNAELDAKAEKELKNGYEIDNLIDAILNERRPITGVESVILAKYQATQEAKILELNNKIESQIDTGVTAFDKLTSERDAALDDLLRAYDASEAAGTVASDALRARKVKVLQDYSLAGMFVKKRKANGNVPLTEEQKKEVTEAYNAIVKANEALEARIKALEEAESLRKANGEIEKTRKEISRESRKQERKTNKDKIISERKSLVDQLKAIADKSRGEVSANPIKAEMLPLIGKLAKTYIQEGFITVEGVVDNVYTEIADIVEGVTKRQVRDAISGYGYPPKETQNELAQKIADLKAQAKLISQIEDAEKGIVREKVPAKKKAKNEETEKLRQKLYEILNPEPTEEEIAQRKNDAYLKTQKANLQKKIDELRKRISNKDFSKPEKNVYELDAEAVRLRDEYRKAKFDYDVALKKDERARRTRLEKSLDLAIEVANLPRAFMATADLSAPLRQGVLFTVSNPSTAMRAGKEMFNQVSSQQRYDRWLADLKDSPGFDLMQKSKLYIADNVNPDVAAKEDEYATNLAQKIPLIGDVVKGSERAYTSYLNKMRVDMFNRGVDLLSKDGLTFENAPQAYKALATYINAGTGRGNLAALEGSAKVLNTALFSPRLMASRIQLLTNWANPRFYKNTPLAVKKMYFKDMLIFIGVGLSVLRLAKLAGAEVEDDWKSSDFGKIKVGDTRWDIWGGFQPYVRFFGQQITGEKKSSTTGSITKLDGSGYGGADRVSEAGRFIRGKESPIVSFGHDAYAGKDMFGNPFNIGEATLKRMWPLVIQGVVESWKEQGVKSLFTVGVPSVFGIGTQTYNENSFLQRGVDNKTLDMLKEKKVVVWEPIDGDIKGIDKETGEEKKITTKEYTKYFQSWSDYVKGDIEDNFKQYSKLNKELLDSRLKTVKIQAKQYAEYKTTGVISGIDKVRVSDKAEGEDKVDVSKTFTLTPDQIKMRQKLNDEFIKKYGPGLIKGYKQSYVAEGYSPKVAEMKAEEDMIKEAAKDSKYQMIYLNDSGKIKLGEK